MGKTSAAVKGRHKDTIINAYWVYNPLQDQPPHLQ